MRASLLSQNALSSTVSADHAVVAPEGKVRLAVMAAVSAMPPGQPLMHGSPDSTGDPVGPPSVPRLRSSPGHIRAQFTKAPCRHCPELHLARRTRAERTRRQDIIHGS